MPVAGRLLAVASIIIIQGSGSIEAFAALTGRERMFAAVLAHGTIFVAVRKPGLGQFRH